MTELEFGWVVGFWEGEGSCRARKNGGGIEMIIGQTSIEPLEKLQSLFGGSIRECVERPKYNPRAQPFWTWTLGGHAARELLIAIEPHVQSVKRRQRIKDTLSVPLAVRKWARDPDKLNAMKEAVANMTKHKRYGFTVKKLALQFGVSPKTIYNIRERYFSGG